MNDLVGKILKDAKDEEYKVLNELRYKNIACVYAQKVGKENENIKKFFQLTGDDDIAIVEVISKKLISGLNDALFELTKPNDKARKIEEKESIADYLAYLDEFYKTKVNPNL